LHVFGIQRGCEWELERHNNSLDRKMEQVEEVKVVKPITKSLSGEEIELRHPIKPPVLMNLIANDTPIAHRKKPSEEVVSTPRGSLERSSSFSLKADIPRKRPLSSASMSNGPSYRRSHVQSSPEYFDSTEFRAWRLGAELNLATPAGERRKSFTAVPVPKAWSTLVLYESSKSSASQDSKDERTKSQDDEKLKVLDTIKRENDMLARNNQVLERENAKLRSFIPTLRRNGSRLPGSPLRRSDSNFGSRRRDLPMGLGDPQCEIIMQAESQERDSNEAFHTKAITRQVFSVNTLVRSLSDTYAEDQLVVMKALRTARAHKKLLEEAQRKIKSLEEEVLQYKRGVGDAIEISAVVSPPQELNTEEEVAMDEVEDEEEEESTDMSYDRICKIKGN